MEEVKQKYAGRKSCGTDSGIPPLHLLLQAILNYLPEESMRLPTVIWDR